MPNGVVLSCEAFPVLVIISSVLILLLSLLSCLLEKITTTHAPPTDSISDITCTKGRTVTFHTNGYYHTLTNVIISPNTGMDNRNVTAGDD